MKCILFSLMILPLLVLQTRRAAAQSAEAQQLILNIQKLAQLKSILNNMYKGYDIITKGYNTIKDISSGNFSMHKLFLDGLLEVSPTVRKYYRVAEIVAMQKTLLQDYKRAWNTFSKLKVFQQQDLQYIRRVHQNLVEGSISNMEELLMVVTAGKLRMSDAERLAAIDRIHQEMTERMDYMRQFHQKAQLLASQRQSLLHDNEFLKRLHHYDNAPPAY